MKKFSLAFLGLVAVTTLCLGIAQPRIVTAEGGEGGGVSDSMGPYVPDSVTPTTQTTVVQPSAPRYSLAASPSVSQGQDITVNWKASPMSSFSWIALSKAGSPVEFPVFWNMKGATSGSFSIPAPKDPGTYSFKYFDQRSPSTAYVGVAVSNPVVVEMLASYAAAAASTSLIASPSVSQGQDITVNWTAPAGSSYDDRISFHVAGNTHSYGIAEIGTGGATSGSFSIPAPPLGLYDRHNNFTPIQATYEFRYYVGDRSNPIAIAVSNPVLVTANTFTGTSMPTGNSLTASPSVVSPGQTLTASWTNARREGSRSTVGLYLAGSDSPPVVWRHTGGATSGSFSIPAPANAGTYEFKYIGMSYGANPGWSGASAPVVVVSSDPTVTPSPVFTPYSITVPATIEQGQDLNVSWASKGLIGHWIGFYKTKALDIAYSDFKYTKDKTSETFSTTNLVPGTYEFRYFLDGGYGKRNTISSVVTITSKAVTSTSTTPTSTPTPAPCTSHKLLPGKTLTPGQTLQSCDKQHILTFGTDGNLTLSNGWSSNTAGSGATSLRMQTDGNLVLYTRTGKAVWSLLSYTGGRMGTGQYLELKDDGTLAVYNTSGAVRWSTTMPLKAVGSISTITPCTVGLGKSVVANGTNAWICDQTISWTSSNAIDVKLIITGDSPYTSASFPSGYTAGTGSSGSATFWVGGQTGGTYKATLYSGSTKLDEKIFTIAAPVAQVQTLNQIATVLEAMRTLLQNWR